MVMDEKLYYVYILASKKQGTLYVGVTGNLIKRIYTHKENINDGFTKKYQIHNLVYYEMHEEIIAAISREKEIKRWSRQTKINLIESNNPTWDDLYLDLIS
jgi:putative endonuclease